jgi:hypothetical protein
MQFGHERHMSTGCRFVKIATCERIFGRYANLDNDNVEKAGSCLQEVPHATARFPESVLC